MLRSGAPTITRGLPKFVRLVRGLILDLLLVRANTTVGHYRVQKARVIKHDVMEKEGGEEKIERERERVQTKHNLIPHRNRPSLIANARAVCKT